MNLLALFHLCTIFVMYNFFDFNHVFIWIFSVYIILKILAMLISNLNICLHVPLMS